MKVKKQLLAFTPLIILSLIGSVNFLFPFKSGQQVSSQFNQASLSSPPLCNDGQSLKFTDLPEAKLLDGIGDSHWEITTSSDSAQIYFDQGINALHAFWDVEAFKAFKKGLKFDSTCAMMHWGLSKSISQTAGELRDLKKAAMDKAVTYSSKANSYEKDFILAYQELAKNGVKAYRAKMEEYTKLYPNQIDAQLFYASSLSSNVRSHSPEGVPTPENIRGQEILNAILSIRPNSSAANHYIIHALENGPTPEKALTNADRIAALAPSSGHITHMPGHIYYRIGDYNKAIATFYNSLNVDSTYMEALKMDPINNWNYTHNIDYLVASCVESGRYEEGLKWARFLSDLSLDKTRSMTGGSGYILFGAYSAIPRLYMRFEEWDKAYQSLDTLLNKIPWSNSKAITYFEGMQFYAQGMHEIQLNRKGKAVEHLNRLKDIQESLEKNRPEIAADWYYRYAVKILAVNAQELEALILYKKGKVDQAIDQLKIAAIEERNIGYWEPPHYTRPVYESLAWIYTKEGNLREATAAYQQALKLRPRNGNSQFALTKAIESLGNDPEKTKAAYQSFLDFWQYADDFKGRISYAKAYIKEH